MYFKICGQATIENTPIRQVKVAHRKSILGQETTNSEVMLNPLTHPRQVSSSFMLLMKIAIVIRFYVFNDGIAFIMCSYII